MLPIHDIRDSILEALGRSNRLVLTAPTGSGKTTQVPQFLLRSELTGGRQIIVLQPRRLAARMVAVRVAAELKTGVGELVGYQTRHESRVSERTRIRFMTEGLFLRLMQSNPTLEGVAAVALDEFHERNVATDVSAALVKRLQEGKRPDLRLVVMSATLETQRIGEYLKCPVLEAHGRMYPIEIRYMARRPVSQRPGTYRTNRSSQAPAWEMAADALADILDSRQAGDVLIFMPGVYEIRRTVDVCQQLARADEPLTVVPLYSELPVGQQDEALAPSPHRKVIVSTNVAETSITIEGVRHVIDSGLARVNRFDPRRGINVLMVEPISQASADQRAGRAGRTAPGTCTRLWPETEHRHRARHLTPEIQRLDLAEVVLQLQAFGIRDLVNFPWLEAPDPMALELAVRTLRMLGALTEDEPPALTALGRNMARLPMHPRLSRMLVEAVKRGCLRRAALWAAFISERDILIRNAKNKFTDDLADEFPRSDFLVLEGALEAARRVNFDPDRCEAMGVHGVAAREVERTWRLYLESGERREERRREDTGGPPVPQLAMCLLAGFLDHLAARRGEANLACALAGNRRGQLDPESVATGAPFVLPVEIREVGTPQAGQTVKTVLSLATEIDPQWLREAHGGRIATERQTFYNPDNRAVETMDREVFEGLILSESPAPTPPGKAAEILAEQVVNGTLKLERWDEAVEQWIERTRCVAQWFPERRMITYDEDERRLIIQEICAGATRYKEIQDRPCLGFVKDALSWDDQRFVERMAPERIELPRGWRMRMDYAAGQSPRGRAKIQDFYGMTQTPTVAGGRVKVLLEILAPNMRPIQMTDDLANFWANLYPTVKKELSRRYPRHEWR